jgi:hypothetical protein
MTIAELVVKLGVTGQGEIQSALSKTKSGLNQVADAAKLAGTAVATGLGVVAVAGVAGLGALGKTAFDSAVAFESLGARLTAITGSGKRAAEVLDTVRKVAAPSPFTFDQLATAATQLEAFGLKTEAILPRLANLGAAFGASEENLKSLVNLFGRLASGNFPDIEQLSAFGLSKSMFTAQGIKFDAGGSLVSSAAETFDALIRIIDTRYSGMMDKLAVTTESKLATLTDKWQGALRVIGETVKNAFEPFIKYASDFLDKLVNSKALTLLVGEFFMPFSKMIEGFSSGSVQSGVDKLLASILVFVAELPQIIEGTFKNLGQMFKNIIFQMQYTLAEAFPNVKIPRVSEYQERLRNIEQKPYMLETMGEFQSSQRYALYLKQKRALDAEFGMSDTGDIMAGTNWGEMGDRFKKVLDRTLQLMGENNLPESATTGVQGVGPYGNITETAKAMGDESNDLLFRIAKNTRDSADALTLRRETLGGGTMGAIGLTGAEVASVNGSYGMFGNGLIPAGTDLERAMRRLIRDESRRNGQPGVMGRF